MSRYQPIAARARRRASRRVVGEHDLLLGDEERVGAEDLSRAARVLDGDEVRVGAERLLRGETEHRRAQGGDHAGNRWARHALAVRADERVGVQRLEVGAHGRDGPCEYV